MDSIEVLLEEIKKGRPIILLDDENRENEGDLILAAEKATPQWLNFMITKGRGLLCLALTQERCQSLGLEPMTSKNKSRHGTAFTVSIEAAKGVSTGISVADRQRTIQAAIHPQAQPEDLVQPGHIFPLQVHPHGVFGRVGHTEASSDLARLAGLNPAGVLIEILSPDGSMARRPELERFARAEGLKMGTVADLIAYRMAREYHISLCAKKKVRTHYGFFDWHLFEDNAQNTYVVLSLGNLCGDEPVLAKMHEIDFWPDLLGQPDALPAVLERIGKAGRGLVIFAAHQCLTIETMRGQSLASVASPCQTTHNMSVCAHILKALKCQKLAFLGSCEERRMLQKVSAQIGAITLI